MILELKNITKSYHTEFMDVPVLSGINLNVEEGEMIAITGASGSGKTTLLNVIGLLDNYDSGEYYFDGKLMCNLPRSLSAQYRNQHIGFVFQSSNLIGYKNIMDNVALPLYYQGVSLPERHKRASECLDKLGLSNWATHYPNELSGGQRQRVAIARAIIGNPNLILADEPTGQLDSATTADVMNVLKSIHEEGKTLIIVTHESDIAAQTERAIRIQDGHIL